jgi:hypothetical protein
MIPCLLLPILKYGNPLAERVEDCQGHVRTSGQAVADCCAGVEGIGVILIENKQAWGSEAAAVRFGYPRKAARGGVENGTRDPHHGTGIGIGEAHTIELV